MNLEALDHVLDDALGLVFSGLDPLLSAERWPEYQQALQPLLLVAHRLLACTDKQANNLDAAVARRAPINWDAVLADVAQSEPAISRKPQGLTTDGPKRTHPGPARRHVSTAAEQMSRTMFH